jgi:hypothetical protein
MILRLQEALTLFLIALRNNCIDGETAGPESMKKVEPLR